MHHERPSIHLTQVNRVVAATGMSAATPLVWLALNIVAFPGITTSPTAWISVKKRWPGKCRLWLDAWSELEAAEFAGQPGLSEPGLYLSPKS